MSLTYKKAMLLVPEISRLILFTEANDILFENKVKRANTLCGENVVLLKITEYGTGTALLKISADLF
jgi:hypothetical protein